MKTKQKFEYYANKELYIFQFYSFKIKYFSFFSKWYIIKNIGLNLNKTSTKVVHKNVSQGCNKSRKSKIKKIMYFNLRKKNLFHNFNI